MNKRRVGFLVLAGLLAGVLSATSNGTYRTIVPVSFTQDWSDTNQVSITDDWSGVSGINGFRGDNLTGLIGEDPKNITAADDPGVLDVNANRGDPNSFITGGVTEFGSIANPVVALQGSATADAPYIQLYLNTDDADNIQLSYKVRDIDGSADNTNQQVNAQIRIGAAGPWANLFGTYIADATDSALAVKVTDISVILPDSVEKQTQVQIRIMTTNAPGSDEWVGIDNIKVEALRPLPSASEKGMIVLAGLLVLAGTAFMIRRKRLAA